MTVSTEFAGAAVVPVRRWVLWRCDSCRRFIPNGVLYLLSDYRNFHVRHAHTCLPKDHEASAVFKVPVKKIQWTDQFNWWMTYLEAVEVLPPLAVDRLLRFLDAHVSFPTGWRPERADLAAPLPVGVA